MAFDFFTLENYWMLPVLIAAIYVAITNFAQANIGGKGRLKQLQLDVRALQKKMTDAAKNKRENELNEAIAQNWKLTMEIMQIQMKMFSVLIGSLLLLSVVFPMFEPGTNDDVKLPLFDDGLASHCDSAAGDLAFSNCYEFPTNGVKGAWVADFYLRSTSGEQIARQGAAIYYGGGVPEDIWLQSASQNSWLDGLTGKKAYSLNASTGKQDYSSGETASISALPLKHVFSARSSVNGVSEAFANNKITLSKDESQPISDFIASNSTYGRFETGSGSYRMKKEPGLFGEQVSVSLESAPEGAIFEAVIDSGTFFHADLPFSIPLLNIRRIIGSYGFFIFTAFVLSIIYSIAKALYVQIRKSQSG